MQFYNSYLKKSFQIILVFIVFILLSGCSLIKPVEFKGVNSFNIQEKSGKLIITTNINLYNPNGLSLSINSADIDVFAEGVNLGKLQIPNEVIISKKETFSGDFMVEISLVKLLVAGKSVLSKLKKREITISLKGSVDANALWMAKKFNVDFTEEIDFKR